MRQIKLITTFLLFALGLGLSQQVPTDWAEFSHASLARVEQSKEVAGQKLILSLQSLIPRRSPPAKKPVRG